MGSIRPLFTITVLVVVGAYLYVKINEGPARQHSQSHEGHDHAADGVPPLVSTSGGATLAQDTTAPAWPGTETKNAGATPPLATTPAVPPLNSGATAAPAMNVAASDNGIRVFRVSNGAISEVAGQPAAEGTLFVAVSSNNRVFATHSDGTVSAFRLDTASGVLARTDGPVQAGNGALEMTILRR